MALVRARRRPVPIFVSPRTCCETYNIDVSDPFRCYGCDTGVFCSSGCAFVRQNHYCLPIPPNMVEDLIQSIPNGKPPRLAGTYTEFYLDHCNNQEELDTLCAVHKLVIKQLCVSSLELSMWLKRGVIYRGISKRFNEKLGMVPMSLRLWVSTNKEIFAQV